MFMKWMSKKKMLWIKCLWKDFYKNRMLMNEMLKIKCKWTKCKKWNDVNEIHVNKLNVYETYA